MNSQYYSVNAKLKAMSAGFLNDLDYEALLSKDGVGGICAYLKNSTVYRKALAGVNEDEIHRAEFEQLLDEECYGGEKNEQENYKYGSEPYACGVGARRFRRNRAGCGSENAAVSDKCASDGEAEPRTCRG